MMSKTVMATDSSVNKLFDRVRFETDNLGWRCAVCQWRVESEGLPPPHSCPRDGEQQRYVDKLLDAPLTTKDWREIEERKAKGRRR